MVITQVNIKTMVYWDVTPYCLVDRYHCATVTSWLLVTSSAGNNTPEHMASLAKKP